MDNLAQAQAIGAFWLNLAKISRRADGVKKFRTTYAAMAINPGDIVTVDTDTEDGLGAALTYLVWTVRRVNNDGDHELTLMVRRLSAAPPVSHLRRLRTAFDAA